MAAVVALTLGSQPTSGERAPWRRLSPWANERVSGSDGGDGGWQHLGAALLSVLIVAAIIVCGSSRPQEVRAYLQLFKSAPANDGRGEAEEVKEGAGRRSPRRRG